MAQAISRTIAATRGLVVQHPVMAKLFSQDPLGPKFAHRQLSESHKHYLRLPHQLSILLWGYLRYQL